MKYKNAKDIFPPSLLAEMKKYAAGQLVYIPSDARKGWGETSGYRRQLKNRNREMIRRFNAGATVDELGDEYYLTPETVKNIVSSKKKRREIYIMELNEIFALYTKENETPISYKLDCEEDYDAPWGEVYYIKDYRVTYPSRTLLVRIEQYWAVTDARVKQMKELIDEYISLGYECARIVENVYGEYSRDVEYNGHPCVVFAEEYDEREEKTKEYAKEDEHGRLIAADEILRAEARIAEKHLEGSEKSYMVLFDSFSACEDDGDWISEYVYGDLKNAVKENLPQLEAKYTLFADAFERNRSKLAEVWDSLPTSVFSGDESDPYILNPDGHFVGFASIEAGGRDVCVNALMNAVLTFTEELGETYKYELPLAGDPGMREKLYAIVRHGFSVIAKDYTFTEAEIDSLVYLYRVYIPARLFYYGDLYKFIKSSDEAPASVILDFMLGKEENGDPDFSFLRG